MAGISSRAWIEFNVSKTGENACAGMFKRNQFTKQNKGVQKKLVRNKFVTLNNVFVRFKPVIYDFQLYEKQKKKTIDTIALSNNNIRFSSNTKINEFK